MNRLFNLLAVIGILFLAAIIFALHIMGDQYCTISILNNGKKPLILKTYHFTRNDTELKGDSITLEVNETIEIGACINCTTPDVFDLEYDALEIYIGDEFQFFNKWDLIEYLESKDKRDCITYVLD